MNGGPLQVRLGLDSFINWPQFDNEYILYVLCMDCIQYVSTNGCFYLFMRTYTNTYIHQHIHIQHTVYIEYIFIHTLHTYILTYNDRYLL